jgi:hypothetical protein
MFETVMMLQAERSESRRREFVADSLSARAARFGYRRSRRDEAETMAPGCRSRAAPATPAPRQAYARAA